MLNYLWTCLWPSCHQRQSEHNSLNWYSVISSHESEGLLNPLELNGDTMCPHGVQWDTPGGSAAQLPGMWIGFVDSKSNRVVGQSLWGGYTFFCDVTCTLTRWSCCLGMREIWGIKWHGDAGLFWVRSLAWSWGREKESGKMRDH